MMTEQQRSAYYVNAYRADDGKLTLHADPDPVAQTERIRAAWHVDGVSSEDEAIASLLTHLADQYLGSDVAVTRLIPRERDASERLEAARSILRADYWNDVRGVVDDVKLDIERRNLTTEDEVSEYIDQACDGHSRVIYTGQAIECLLFTRNDEAYEEYGSLGDLGADNTGEMYTKLAYYAFRADVSDELGDVAALLEEAEPDECEDCGEELPIDTEGDKCADCAADAEACDNGCAGCTNCESK